MITARNLGAAGVFSGLDFEVPAGGLLLVEGAHRSGRTALLLAISGRFRSTGTLRAPARHHTALAEQPTINPLDEALTVEQHFAQALALAAPWWKPFVSAARARAAVPTGLPGNARIGDLTPLQRFACGVALALVGRPEVLVVDDVDALRESADRRAAWQLLNGLPADLTIVASCQDSAEYESSDIHPLTFVSLSPRSLTV